MRTVRNWPFALVILTRFAFAGPQIPEPRVRPGHNPAVLERSDPVWKTAYEETAATHHRGPGRIAPKTPMAKLIRGSTAEKVVSLTFDDGPHPYYTEALLTILKLEGVKATFFTVGKMGEKYSNLLRRIVEDGHEIGNHTFSHTTLSNLSATDIETEYRANSAVIEAATGKRPVFCRPPGGRYNELAIRIAQDLGMTTTLWTDDPGDYEITDPKKLERQTFSKVANGGIILLHSGVAQTLEILPELIHSVRRQGFRFVSLAELEAGLQRSRR